VTCEYLLEEMKYPFPEFDYTLERDKTDCASSMNQANKRLVFSQIKRKPGVRRGDN